MKAKFWICVEVDGSQHHSAQGKAYDLERSAILDRYGLKVIRFTNREIDRQFMTVCAKIEQAVNERMKELYHCCLSEGDFAER